MNDDDKIQVHDINKTHPSKIKKTPFSFGMVVLSSVLITLFTLFCIKIKSIMFPFAFAFVFSYLFAPLIQKLERYKIPSGLSSFCIVVIFFLIVSSLIILLAPLLTYKTIIIIKKIPDILSYLQDDIVSPIILKLSKYIDLDTSAFVLDEKIMKKITDNIQYLSSHIIRIALYSSSSAVFLFTVLLLTPILCFYVLSSFHGISRNFISIIPIRYKVQVLNLQHEIRQGITSYLKGQLTVTSILASYYSISLMIAGLNGGLLLGIATGIFGIIPYFGVFCCTIIGIIIAFYQFGNSYMLFVILTIFISGQIIDGSFITPNVIGKKIGINPAIIIFGFLVCGILFKFWGVLLAVPITLVFYIVLKFFLNNFYKKSDYYNF